MCPVLSLFLSFVCRSQPPDNGPLFQLFSVCLLLPLLLQFVVGFQKEQVNANLLNGKGEIHNVELNCRYLNDEVLNKITPFVELERVHVSKLSFHVTSWTNLRKAPIVVDIEHVRFNYYDYMFCVRC